MDFGGLILAAIDAVDAETHDKQWGDVGSSSSDAKSAAKLAREAKLEVACKIINNFLSENM
jgi:hypothetical protein